MSVVSSMVARLRRARRRTRLLLGVAAAAALVTASEERARTFSFSYEPRPAIRTASADALAAAASELLSRAHAATGFRGCIGLALGKEVLMARCEGVDGAPLTPSTRFSIGSLWKQHVGFAVQERVRRGRLRLDDPIQRWLPELAGSPSGPLTIDQLLHMTSGLPYVIGAGANLRTQLSRAQRTDVDFLLEVRAYRPSFAPGTRFQYSNVGYGLLAIALGRVDGRPWRDVLSDLYAREGMTDTGFMTGGPAEASVVTGRLPVRCGMLFGPPCMLTLPRWNYSMLPGGGVYSTLEDSLRWGAAMARMAAEDPALYDAFTAAPPPSDGYASGWIRDTRELPDGTSVSCFVHGGEDPGYISYFVRVPSRDLTVIALSNTDFTLDRARFTLFTDLVDLVTGAPYRVMTL